MNDQGLIQYLGSAETVTVHTLKEAIKKSVLAFRRPLPDSGRWLTDGWGTSNYLHFFWVHNVPFLLARIN